MSEKMECPRCLGDLEVYDEYNGGFKVCPQCGGVGEVLLPKDPIVYIRMVLPPASNDESASSYRSSVSYILRNAERLYGDKNEN